MDPITLSVTHLFVMPDALVSHPLGLAKFVSNFLSNEDTKSQDSLTRGLKNLLTKYDMDLFLILGLDGKAEVLTAEELAERIYPLVRNLNEQKQDRNLGLNISFSDRRR